MTGTDTEERTPCCARCGYDLRGAVATWTDACPLEGRCTECGFTFEWAELLSPHWQLPLWNVEFAPRGHIQASIVITLGTLVTPWRFWHKLRMYYEPRLKRIGLYFALLALMTYMLLAVCQALLAWKEVVHIETYRPMMPYVPPLASPSGTISPMFAASWGLMFPISNTSAGNVADWQGNLQAVRSPRETIRQAITGELYRRPAARGSHLTPGMRFALAGSFSMMLLAFMAGVFVLLPQTMQRAPVRPVHVARIFLYSWTLLFIALWAFIIAVTLQWNLESYYAVLLALLPLAVFVYWGSAFSRYLHLPNAWWVAGILCATSALASYSVLHFFVDDLPARLLLG